ADAGTVSALRIGADNCTVAYIPGLMRRPGFASEMRARNVRVCSCTVGYTKSTRPVNVRPGNAANSIVAVAPARTHAASASRHSASTHTRDKSATVYNGVPGCTA